MDSPLKSGSSATLSLLTFRNLVLVLVGYIFARIVYQIVHYRWFHPLSKFPGPFWASVTRLWIAYHNLKEDEHLVCLELHKKYGPIIRVTPTLLLVSDATKLPEIYHRYADKSKHYITGSFGNVESLFNMQDSKMHARFRKVAAGSYSFSNIKKMEPLIDLRINDWINELRTRFAKTGEKLDFAPWAVYMAYDVISEVGFGAPFGFIKSGSDVAGLIKGLHEGLVPFGLMARLYPFTGWIKRTAFGDKYLVARPEQESGIGTLMRFRDKLIEQRRKDIGTGNTNGRIDLLQTFIDARDEKGEPLDPEYIRAEILLVLLAGADTTGTAFQALMRDILTHPSVYTTLMTELDAATAAGHLSSMPQYHEVVEHCPFYMACIKESMRLTPSAPNIFPRMVSKGGMTLFNTHIPENMEVSCNPYIVHRDPAIYGPDADVFRPSRWLQDEEKTKLFNKYSLGFGYGARGCLGKEIANMELYKAPLQFLRTFRLEVEDKEMPGKYVYKGGLSYFTDMWMKIEEREIVEKQY
ncbi:flavonoid 3',5'-hydroxylase, partial [Aureobasidium melanogenum]